MWWDVTKHVKRKTNNSGLCCLVFICILSHSDLILLHPTGSCSYLRQGKTKTIFDCAIYGTTAATGCKWLQHVHWSYLARRWNSSTKWVHIQKWLKILKKIVFSKPSAAFCIEWRKLTQMHTSNIKQWKRVIQLRTIFSMLKKNWFRFLLPPRKNKFLLAPLMEQQLQQDAAICRWLLMHTADAFFHCYVRVWSYLARRWNSSAKWVHIAKCLKLLNLFLCLFETFCNLMHWIPLNDTSCS